MLLNVNICMADLIVYDYIYITLINCNLQNLLDTHTNKHTNIIHSKHRQLKDVRDKSISLPSECLQNSSLTCTQILGHRTPITPPSNNIQGFMSRRYLGICVPNLKTIVKSYKHLMPKNLGVV